MLQAKGNTPEANAGAFCVWTLMNSHIGKDDDKKGTLNENDIEAYVEKLYDSGFDSEGYYNYLLENNFISEDSVFHAEYLKAIDAYKSLKDE